MNYVRPVRQALLWVYTSKNELVLSIPMNYADTLVPLIREIRPMVLPYWGNVSSTAKSASPADLVTALDTGVETFIAGRLRELYPHIPFVGEEFGGIRDGQKHWLMDPIDGTAHFVRGLPFCTSMLALVEDDQVLFSLIYDFIHDHVYWAQKGQGAFKDGVPLQVSNRPLTDAYYSYEMKLAKPENVALFSRLVGNGIMMKTVSAGWEFIMIAEGKLEARVTVDPHGKDYDFAPGALLVAEAGGVVRNIGSHTYDYRNLNFIAATPAAYEDLRRIVEG